MTTLFTNILKVISRNSSRILRKAKIPLAFISFNLFNYYLNSNKVELKTIPVNNTQFQIQIFSDQLYNKKCKKDDIIIMIDLDYNQDFTNKLKNILGELAAKAKNAERKLTILSIRFNSQQQKHNFQQKYKVDIPQQTIFLIKNRYSLTLKPFLFQQVIYQPRSLRIYFSQLPLINDQQINVLQKNLSILNKNMPILVFYANKDSQKYGQLQRMFKFVQLYLCQKYKDPILPIIINNSEYLKHFGLQGVENNSFHLIKKYSKYSLGEADTQLFNKKYQIIKNITLHTPQGDLLIGYYLQKKQIFSNILRDYTLKLSIDKNSISKKLKKNLIQVFKNIKNNNRFQNINFSIKFQKIPSNYQTQKPQPYLIKLINNKAEQQQLDATENPSHQSKQILPKVGKHSFQYLFDKDQVHQLNIIQFIQNVQNNKQPEYFRSQKFKPLSNLNRLTSASFNKKILNNTDDHIVFQYSGYCSGCKALAPLIYNFSKQNTQNNIKVHRLNSIKNIVQNQIQYPFTPVILYFKNGWKNTPIFVQPTIILRDNGLKDFCEITHELGSVQRNKLEQHYNNNQKLDWSVFIGKE